MKKLWKKWCEQGLKWPYLHDPVSGKPSITLLFPYITFVIAVASVVMLHWHPSLILATYTSIFFWAISTVFYMLRKLSQAKFNLDDRSIELDAGSDSSEDQGSSEPSPDDLTGN